MHPLEKAIQILKYAIDKNTTLSQACKIFKVGEKFIREKKGKFLDHDQYAEFERLYNAAKKKINTIDSQQIIEKEETNVIEEGKNNAVLDAKGLKHVKTLEVLIKEAKIDLKIWNIDRHVINKWDVTNAEGQTYQNWQVKAWLSKIKTEEQEKQFEEFIETIKKYAPRNTFTPHRKTKDKKYSFELSLPDLHIGKQSWALESGEDYDTKIAIDVYNEAVESLVEQITHFAGEVEEILLPIGNDLINIDNMTNMTTNGTPQNVDSRWQQMFLKAQKLLVHNIDRLTGIAPVKVIMVSGNHDYQTIFYLGEALKAWYRNDKNVIVDNSPKQRKYHKYGNNLTMWTHGNEEKHGDLGLIMATEESVLWAETLFREAHLGHLHKSKEVNWIVADEKQGFKYKILPSLSATDAWHYRKGYKSVRAAKGMMYHKEKGMIAEYTFNVM